MILTLNVQDQKKVPQYIKELQNQKLSSQLFYYDNASSTMDIGKDLVKNNKADHGDVILAEHQQGGRGRRGRLWSSPSGGLWFTVVLNPPLTAGKNPLIALMSAVSVVQAIKDITGITVSIKWPNDILYNNKKLCGIALDLVFDSKFKPWILLGIGLNVNVDTNCLPKDVKDIATSITNETGKQHNRASLLVLIIENLMLNLKKLQTDEADALNEWRKYDITLGSTVDVYPVAGKEPYVGTAINIDENGALIIKDLNNELKTVFAADVSVRIKK
ncbi:biotin--[acetyl-CoA-carboxylase] ligase [Clostridium sp. 'deep sea']|uniref:biotin--[acetyl-CoA-carboxylase] ligase n=1 Tax=Clostridium sp. 'deep sea' TaxID=2779445 RepID=UPI0018968259|nr:biotin--[acetyl-CoA-carboxylase] ligase [Clostridium sp. 'deep sea']QOR34531.1 biotin--[acetyl-CoA-carboxylase] ligase [Clostridium sp. 'deep sea']